MPNSHFPGIAAAAKIGGHPIHPMLVPFPIALLVAAFACDLVFWRTGNTFWAQAAFWSFAAAIITALAAALAGVTDFLGNDRIRALGDAWKHMLGNFLAVVLAGINLWLRYDDAAGAVLPWGLTLSTVIVLLLLYTGWKGGELVYRFRVGVRREEADAHPAVLRQGIVD
jgi:uncharacterized membrane protein